MNLNQFNSSIQDEIKNYTENMFQKDVSIPEEIKDEPFISTFNSLIEEIKQHSIETVLNQSFAHGDEEIKFYNPSDITLEIYNSISGNIPIFYARNEHDFEELITKIIHKGKKDSNIKSVGASFVHGKDIRFIILSNKPYSNISAKELMLDNNTWKNYSLIIRREHECTHYFTKRFLGSSRNNIHDELIADFLGITSAYGYYDNICFLRGIGIDKFPEPQEERRFPVYTKGLSEEAKRALKYITIKASENVRTWSETKDAKKLNNIDKIIFLTNKSLLELYDLYK